MSKPTPNYFHCVEEKRFRDNVYEPEADSFLFLDALDQERNGLFADLIEAHRSRPSSSPLRVLEVGPGSGIVITHFAMIMRSLGLSALDAHAVDINPLALEATELTWTRSGFCRSHVTGDASANTQHTSTVVSSTTSSDAATVDPTVTDTSFQLHLHRGTLFSPFQKSEPTDAIHCNVELAALPETACPTFDVVLFNPPYVPTSEAELNEALGGNDQITLAWCGGPKGRVVVDRFLTQLPFHLHQHHGVCYLIAIKENDVDDLIQFAKQSFTISGDMQSRVVVSRILQRYTGEHLCVVRIQRNGDR